MTTSDRGTPPPLVQHPQSLHELAPGLSLARGGPGRTLNVYLLGTVVLDSGVRWSRRRLARQLAGRQVTAHALTHAHFDHAGSSAWLCRTLGVPLWCGAGDAAAIGSGQVDTHGSAWCNRLQRTLAPVTAHPVSRALREGDLVERFEVLEVPGHSPGALAFWRERDRVLVCGDVLANFGLHPSRPRLVLAPAALSSDYEQNRRSAARLAGLRPRLACFGHGFALTDPGRFATAIDQLGPAPS
ncbi:MAG TPA: MBL fold metallo-hydrolase [Actinomycetes bacterium]|nr:MBL fold metallo-hydrolase [Actinomycetes bacterium]